MPATPYATRQDCLVRDATRHAPDLTDAPRTSTEGRPRRRARGQLHPTMPRHRPARPRASSAPDGTSSAAVTVTGYRVDNSFTDPATGQTIRRMRLEAGDIAVSLRFVTAQVTKRTTARPGPSTELRRSGRCRSRMRSGPWNRAGRCRRRRRGSGRRRPGRCRKGRASRWRVASTAARSCCSLSLSCRSTVDRAELATAGRRAGCAAHHVPAVGAVLDPDRRHPAGRH